MENTIQSQEKTIESNGAAIERLTKKTMDGTKVEDDLRDKLNLIQEELNREKEESKKKILHLTGENEKKGK